MYTVYDLELKILSFLKPQKPTILNIKLRFFLDTMNFMRQGRLLKSSKRLVIMKAEKMIEIFQNVGYYEGREDYQNLPKGWLL